MSGLSFIQEAIVTRASATVCVRRLTAVPTTDEQVRSDMDTADPIEKLSEYTRSHPYFARLLSGLAEYFDFTTAEFRVSEKLLRARAVDCIISEGYLCELIHFGWIDEKGVFLGCDYSSHEALIDLIGIEFAEAERSWVRVSAAVQFSRNPTRAQWMALESLGSAVLAEAVAEMSRISA